MLNRAVLMGRLTRDPELRYTQNNIAVTSFTLAGDRNFGRQGDQKQTDFIDIVAWRNTAEFVSKYFKKGQLVAVAGSIQTRNWEDKSGNKRVSVEVVADETYFAEGKRDAQPRDPYSGPSDFDAPLGGGSDFREATDDDGELPF